MHNFYMAQMGGTEEFATLNRDKPMDKELKSEEQLKRHSIDSGLEGKPIDRALYLLNIGEEIQRLSVLQNLPQLLEGNESLCMQKVIPKVQLALPNASTEFHMAASTTFKTILEKKLVHPRTFTQTFLHSILSSIDSRDPVVANAWVETLLDVIDLLPPDVVKSDILPISVVKGQMSQRIFSRLMACKLLGKICTRVDQLTLKKEMLPIVLSLCQDIKGEVRACICSQLPFLAQGLGAEGVKPTVLPILVELASDEESMVRLAAVEAIVCMLPYLQQDTLKHTIVPLVKKTCESAMHYEDNVMVILAQVFGELCLGLEATLSPVEKKWLLCYYQQLSELGLRTSDFAIGGRNNGNMPDIIPSANNADRFVECRHHCAFHFPAMVKFGVAAADNFDEQLYPVFSGLACDPYFEVRRTIACGLHEVARVLGPNNGVVKPELVKLLRDDSEEVLEGLIPNLSKTLILLAKSGSLNPDHVDNNVLEVGRALLKCESEVSGTKNWRLHELLIQQLECLYQVLPSDFIHTHFTPMLFSRIHRVRQVPVRLAATRTLLVILRYNAKNLQKTDIRSRIISELGNGRSCFSRMSFLRLCGQALELFSRRYFKEHFYLSLLERAEDKVPNIRLMLVYLLPQLKACLRMPSDKKYFTSLETSIRKLLTHEKDRDVLAALEQSLPALDRMECLMDTDRVTLQSSKEDQEDQRKAEEEARMSKVFVVPRDTRNPASHTTAPTNFTVGPPPPRGAAAAVAPSIPQSTSKIGSAARVVPARNSSSVAGKPSVLGTEPPKLSKPSLSDKSSSQVLSTLPSRTSNTRAPPMPPPPSKYPSPNSSRLELNNRHFSSHSIMPNQQTATSKESLKSLEDEFYRDAGIKIPQQFSTPTKIPNLRDSLMYKSRDTMAYATENRNVEEDSKEEPTFAKGPQSRPRKSVPSTNAQKSEPERRDGVAKSPGVIANRRHSYLTSEKVAKVTVKVEESSGGGVQTRVATAVDASRRHSYIERLQISNQDSNTKSEGSPQSKRSSFVAREQTYRGASQNVKPAIPLRRGLIRPEQGSDSNPDGDNRRRSLNFGQGERIQRGFNVGGTETDDLKARGSNRKTDVENRRRSLNFGQGERNQRGLNVSGGGDSLGNSAKRRSLVAPGLVSKLVANRRHSSLERDDAEGVRGSLRSPSPRLQKDDLPSSDEGTLSTRLRRPGFVFRNDAADDRLGKAPRSNNSSPGSSRSSSPSMAGRGRHLTAPNSRAGSPTAATKRLSLGTLNSYMTNMKLTEPSSRLPIRKK